jgi:hypothetical protein
LTFAQANAIKQSWIRVVSKEIQADNIILEENAESDTMNVDRPLSLREEVRGSGEDQRIVSKLTQREQAERLSYKANNLSIIDADNTNEEEIE